MKKIKRLVSFIVTSVLVITMVSISNISAESTVETFNLAEDYTQLFTADTITDSDNNSMNYQYYVPEDYDSSKSYPLVVFLHGAGERGNDNTKQLTNSSLMPHYFTKDNLEKYPCIILAPQCPIGKTWANATLGDKWGNVSYSADEYETSVYEAMVISLVDKLCADYNIDQSRLYITGISMGGYGTWDIITRYPDKFAAAMPICGGCDSTKAEMLKNINIRTYHGADDTTVYPSGTEAMFKAMQENDTAAVKYVSNSYGRITETVTSLEDENTATFIYTEYTGVGHGCWDTAYSDKRSFAWLFSQVKTGTGVDKTALNNKLLAAGQIDTEKLSEEEADLLETAMENAEKLLNQKEISAAQNTEALALFPEFVADEPKAEISFMVIAVTAGVIIAMAAAVIVLVIIRKKKKA